MSLEWNEKQRRVKEWLDETRLGATVKSEENVSISEALYAIGEFGLIEVGKLDVEQATLIAAIVERCKREPFPEELWI